MWSFICHPPGVRLEYALSKCGVLGLNLSQGELFITIFRWILGSLRVLMGAYPHPVGEGILNIFFLRFLQSTSWQEWGTWISSSKHRCFFFLYHVDNQMASVPCTDVYSEAWAFGLLLSSYPFCSSLQFLFQNRRRSSYFECLSM